LTKVRLEIISDCEAEPVPDLLMYYTRSVVRIRMAVAIAVVAAIVSSPTASRARDGQPRTARYPAEGPTAVEVRFQLGDERPAQSQRVVEITMSTLARFADWFGPFPYSELTVIEEPWRSDAGRAPSPGVIVVQSRFIQPDTDRSLERALITALACQYWVGQCGAASGHWLSEGLALYAAVRGINQELEGRHPVSVRYFGAFVPFRISSMEWSPSGLGPRPRVRLIDESLTRNVERRAQRAALALHSLERYIGWPALQQALEAFQAEARSGLDPVARLSTIVSEQRGHDMTWFFNEAFRSEAVFDYGIEAFASQLSPGERGNYSTTVRVRRYGGAMLARSSQAPSSPYGGGRALPLLVRFEDGSEIREWLDGRESGTELRYTSPSPGVVASVDPDSALVLDADRSNNTRRLESSMDPSGVRMALRWVLWLQDTMLTYSGLS
jgi:hypothetical protein